MDVTISGLTGALSGVIAVLVWYPLETGRIRLQMQ